MRIKLKDNFNIYLGHKTAVLNPGLTFIAGCNGSGKSTFVKEVARNCRNKHIPLAFLDCRELFNITDLNRVDESLFSAATVMQRRFSSEYEHYQAMFGDWISHIRPSDNFRGKRFFCSY